MAIPSLDLASALFLTQVEPPQGIPGDDTALNGIRLHCTRGNAEQNTHVVESQSGRWEFGTRSPPKKSVIEYLSSLCKALGSIPNGKGTLLARKDAPSRGELCYSYRGVGWKSAPLHSGKHRRLDPIYPVLVGPGLAGPRWVGGAHRAN